MKTEALSQRQSELVWNGNTISTRSNIDSSTHLDRPIRYYLWVSSGSLHSHTSLHIIDHWWVCPIADALFICHDSVQKFQLPDGEHNLNEWSSPIYTSCFVGAPFWHLKNFLFATSPWKHSSLLMDSDNITQFPLRIGRTQTLHNSKKTRLG